MRKTHIKIKIRDLIEAMKERDVENWYELNQFRDLMDALASQLSELHEISFDRDSISPLNGVLEVLSDCLKESKINEAGTYAYEIGEALQDMEYNTDYDHEIQDRVVEARDGLMEILEAKEKCLTEKSAKI